MRNEQQLAQTTQEFQAYEARAERRIQGLENEVQGLKATIDDKDREVFFANSCWLC